MQVELGYETENGAEKKLTNSLRRTYLLSRLTPDSPARVLAAGVFCQAANDLQKFRYERRHGGRVLYAEVRDWVASDDRSWSYSFLNLCDALHLPHDRVRAELLADELTPNTTNLRNYLNMNKYTEASRGIKNPLQKKAYDAVSAALPFAVDPLKITVEPGLSYTRSPIKAHDYAAGVMSAFGSVVEHLGVLRGGCPRRRLGSTGDAVDFFSTRLNYNSSMATAVSDVLVNSNSPGALERLGLNETVLREINPNLIYAGVTYCAPSTPSVLEARLKTPPPSPRSSMPKPTTRLRMRPSRAHRES